MNTAALTERQQAELEFYEEHAKRYAPREVRFDPVLGRERRPWNSYWFVYEQAMNLCRAGARTLLDFGCGKGDISVRLAKVGYDVCGFDLSPGNIAAAQHLARQYNFAEQTHFSVGTAEWLEYPNASFDVVVGMDILHHVEIQPAVTETLRVLKPGGVAIFREHIEVPVQEWFRGSRLGRWLVPPGESLDRNITRHERKLNADDLRTIRELCPSLRIRRFTLLSRLDTLLRRSDSPRPSWLERLDRHLLRLLPPLRPLGASGVLMLSRER